MNNSYQRRPRIWQETRKAAAFVIGERVRIVHAPASYGYNGRAGIVVGIDGTNISVMVDEHPDDLRCTAFYAEELGHEVVP